jgi:hypothetical protein
MVPYLMSSYIFDLKVTTVWFFNEGISGNPSENRQIHWYFQPSLSYHVVSVKEGCKYL